MASPGNPVAYPGHQNLCHSTLRYGSSSCSIVDDELTPHYAVERHIVVPFFLDQLVPSLVALLRRDPCKGRRWRTGASRTVGTLRVPELHSAGLESQRCPHRLVGPAGFDQAARTSPSPRLLAHRALGVVRRLVRRPGRRSAPTSLIRDPFRYFTATVPARTRRRACAGWTHPTRPKRQANTELIGAQTRGGGSREFSLRFWLAARGSDGSSGNPLTAA